MEASVPQPPEPQRFSAENKRRFQDEYEFSYLSDAAELICQDSDLQIFQRFDELRIFVILRHQRRLAGLAEELEAFKSKAQINANQGDLWMDRTLDDFTRDIESALRDYDAAILAQTRVDQFPSPPQNFVNSFIRFCSSNIYMLNVDLGVNKPTRKNRKTADSLAAIAAKEKSWTHRLIDQSKFLRTHLARTLEHRTIENKRRNNNGWHIITYSESKIRRAELIFMNVAFSLMLICPVIALSLIERALWKLVVVLCFLLLGAILTSGVITKANNTGLGVLAGYGAILVFFLGVNTNTTP